MAAFILTYELNSKDKNYSDFHNHIKSYFHAKLSQSSYVIYTDHPAAHIYKRLRPSIEKNDWLYIIQLSTQWAGFCPARNRDWLVSHLSSPS